VPENNQGLKGGPQFHNGIQKERRSRRAIHWPGFMQARNHELALLVKIMEMPNCFF